MASFEQEEKSKLWSVRFRTMEHGKEVNKRLRGLKTKKAAQQAYVDYMSTHIDDTTDCQELTLKHATIAYLENLKANAKYSTYKTQTFQATKNIIPFFGENKLIEQLSANNVREWQNNLTAAGFSYKYKMVIRGTLHAILEFCVKSCGLKENVVKLVDGFKHLEQRKEMSFWTEVDFANFIVVVDEIKYKALFSFLYIMGCRKGETLALTWNDINLENKTVRINKSVSKESIDGNSFAITSPKTQNSYRTISLPDNLLSLLKEYKLSLKNIAQTNYIFGSEVPLPFNTLRMRFVGYIEKSGVPYIRIHDLRHSAVSYMINNGTNGVADVYIIAQRIGDNVEQIYKTYGHLFPKKEETILNSFNKINLF